MRWLLVALWLFALWPSSALARRIVYVVSVGNNAAPSNHPELTPLRYADDDAVRFHQLLGTRSARATLLTALDADTQRRHPELHPLPASFAQLRATLLQTRDAIRRDKERGDSPVVLLTYSGHGASDAAGNPSLSLTDQPLTRERLFDELLPLLAAAEVHLIVDACRAGGVLGVRGAFDVEMEGTLGSATQTQQSQLLAAHSLSRFPNVGALVATAAGQETHEWSQIESGVFTHEVLSALRGAADINGDLSLAYSEVRAFVANANRDLTNPKARPSLLAHVPGGAPDAIMLSLADLPNTRLVYGDAGALGHFYVELNSGERLLDAHLVPKQRAVLAVPADARGFLHSGQREAELPRGPGNIALAGLTFLERGSEARGSVEHALRDGLFASPFGPTYYLGFVDSTGIPSVPFGTQRAIPSDSDTLARRGSRRVWAVAATSLASASAVAFAVTLGLARKTKADFDDTEQERQAHELRDEQQRYARAAAGLSVVSLTAAGAAVWLWPSAARDEVGGLHLTVAAHARF